MEHFKASDDDWQQIEADAVILPIPSTICELRDRVAALEAKRVAPVQVPPTTVPTPPPLSPSADSLWEARLHVYRQGLAAGYQQGLAAGRAEQQAATEESSAAQSDPAMTALELPRDWYPDFADWLERQMPEGTVIGDPLWWASCIADWLIAKATLGPEPNLHGIALGMVDSLGRSFHVLPEILDTLRRAIREPMAEQQAAAEATTEPEPSPSPAAERGLVEVIADLLGHLGDGTARDVIRAVARWLRSMGNFSAATNLEREANR